MSDTYIENAETHLQALRTAYFPWSVEESTLAANVIRALIDERAAVEAIHRPKHGERRAGFEYVDGLSSRLTAPRWVPYVTCAGCSADWPCVTARALGYKPTESSGGSND